MTELFLQVVNLSYSALWIVAAILLLRTVLRKAPKWLHVLLWGLVGLRLVLPFSIESSLSLQPSARVIRPAVMKTGAPEIHTGIAALNYIANHNINYVNNGRDWASILAIIWLVGVAVMLVYAAISYGRLKRRLHPLNLFSEGVFICENLSFSFILGVFKPSVYVPNTLSETEMGYILAHEQAHIRRKDHIWKPLGFVLLSIHWFNPALWLAYILLCRDIELACDEKVIRELGDLQRADYSQTILNCGISRRQVSACPLAFGGAPIKTRIRRVLHYKRPAFRIILLAVLVSVVAAVCLLTVPWENGQLILDGYIFQQAEYEEQLPNGAREIGRVLDTSDAEIRGVNLPKKYFGLPVYRQAGDPQKLYIPTSKGFLCFYSSQWIADTIMQPTNSNLRGMFDNFLFLEGNNGLTYRYERADVYGETMTQGVLLDSFIERATPKNVQWEIYSFEDISALTSVLAVADGVYKFRYDYSPAKGVSAEVLQQAKADGYAVLEDGTPTYGQELWQEFYEKTQRGEPASIQIARWYTLDPERCDTAYYEDNKEDYPAIYYEEIRFDGKFYQVLDWQDNRSYIPTYEHLMRFETESGTQYSKDEPQTVIRYVLTNDENARWEDLFYSMVSSTMGAHIDHYSVWSEDS